MSVATQQAIAASPQTPLPARLDKRERNRLACTKLHGKKKQEQETMEQTNKELTLEVASLKLRVKGL
ncbi:hypothetical protein HDU98_002903 [Podochytrium sp. JEL0797]|nr:hypothetical protein HDU98_002903 [Podochytrium sp. JEL0797]